MITTYEETKRIKRGGAILEPAYSALIDKIKIVYGVKPLNIICDHVHGNIKWPRVDICFEYEKDSRLFHDNELIGCNFNEKKQNEIAYYFEEYLKQYGCNREEIFNLRPWDNYKDKILVIFSAFERDAKSEANGKISHDDLKILKKKIDNKALWAIARHSWGTTFLVYTDVQKEKYKDSSLLIQWTDEYYKILKKHDEFNYFNRSEYSIGIDSKENFKGHRVVTEL